MLSPMNRRWTVLCLCFLSVAACAPKALSLPSEEVLRRAIVAAPSVSSSAFSAEGTLQYSGGVFGEGDGTVRVEGVMQDGGNMAKSTVNLALRFRSDDGQEQSIQALLEMILVSGRRLYLNVSTLESPPEFSVFDPALVATFLGRWWIFEAPEENAAIPVAPSPRLLQAQASVVTVTRDLGVTALNGVTAYHYGVAIDPDRYLDYARELHRDAGAVLDEAAARAEIDRLQATGELWIAAEDFRILKVMWDIPALPLPEGSTLHAVFTITWEDAGNVDPIVIPADARRFSAAEVLPMQTPSAEDAVPAGMQEAEIRSAIDAYSDTAIFPPEQ